MNFGIKKSAVLAIKRGKEFECSGTDLGQETVIQPVDDEGCKQLVVLEKEVCHQKVKKNVEMNT